MENIYATREQIISTKIILHKLILTIRAWFSCHMNKQWDSIREIARMWINYKSKLTLRYSWTICLCSWWIFIESLLVWSGVAGLKCGSNVRHMESRSESASSMHDPSISEAFWSPPPPPVFPIIEKLIIIEHYRSFQAPFKWNEVFF